MSFETEVFLYTSKPVVAVYTVSCITPFFFFFLEVVSEPRPAAYTMYNNLNWISFKRTDDRDTIYDGCNMIKGTH